MRFRPAVIVLYLVAAFSLLCMLPQTSADEVEGRSDVMGFYAVANEEQCRRLCWYRKLCDLYSYHRLSQSQAFNCVLHTSPFENTSLPDGWVTTHCSNNTSSSQGCKTRPCSETEVCMPVVGTTRAQHMCLPLPAHCGVPSVKNGSLSWSGTTQGHTANVTCDPYFRLIPASASLLTCYVTSVWRPDNVVCEIICLNGGVRVGDECSCPIQYSGVHCERYIRDCGEAYENGFQDENYNGSYLIQPLTSPQPFLVQCIFKNGGRTVPLRHRYNDFHTMDWGNLKDGVLDDLEQNPQSWDFFVGLENLHHLTQQAYYNLNLVMWGGINGAGSLYTRFAVGPENSSFVLTYDTNRPRQDGKGGNGFDGTAPLLFSTQDQDNNNCAGMKGAPGWYGADCNGYSVFAQNLVWPVKGSDNDFNAVEFKFKRMAAFYTD